MPPSFLSPPDSTRRVWPFPSRSRWLCPLAEVDDPAMYGHKAYNLARMHRLQLTVPAGVVLSDTLFQRFLEEHGFRATFAAIVQRADASQPQSLRDASDQIAQAVLGASLPGVLTQSLEVLGDHLGDGVWVVRSSAVGEDSCEAAFPGMLDSVLHVRSQAMLHEAIRRCWASYWSERCLFYRATRRVALAGMGVIIQEQVPAAVSGVLFTRTPGAVGEAADAMVLECCPGLADALVSGRITPQRVFISRTNGSRSTVTSSPTQDREPELLDERALANLHAAAVKLEEAFAGPQDIEWSIDQQGTLFLLQSRPITTRIGSVSCPSAARPSADGRCVIYSNANVNENYPDPITPFLFSVASLGYYHYFRNLGLGLGLDRSRVEAMEQPLRSLVAIHGGRIYYNLSNIHAVLRMCPGGDFLAAAFDQFTGTSGRTEQDAGLTWQGFRLPLYRRVLECGRVLRRTWRNMRRLPEGVAAFEATVDAFAARTQPLALAACSPRELLEHLHGFLEIRCHRWFPASLADAASMISYGLLKRMLRREFPEAEQAALHNSLLIGLRNVVSAEPAVRLWQLSRKIREDGTLRHLFQNPDSTWILERLSHLDPTRGFAAEFQGYLDEWGFRRSGELMLTRPSYQEHPAALLDLLRAYATQEDPAAGERREQQQATREAETARVLAILRRRRWLRYLPFVSKAAVARRLLEWTQQAIALRERARHRQALLYSRVRYVLLALGDKLTQAKGLTHRDEVFFLRCEELEEWVARETLAPHEQQQTVRTRMQEHARWLTCSPPETIELPPGADWTDAGDEAQGASTSIAAGVSSELCGTSACGGQAAGRAAVLFDIAEFDRLSAGDILVAPQTDPGWGPVFFRIRGLVIERGGMLSHGAILAREYGIPTVVGVKDATQRIRHGQWIEVNGDRGVVELGD